MLHGYADSAANFMRTTDMNRIAAHYGFAVCYPQGAKSSDTEFPYNHWNADFTYTTNDDTGFLSDLAAYLQETYHLSPDATFAAGLSNGGFMAYTLAVKAPGVFRAVGVVAGSMSGKSWEDRAAAQAIPIVHIHGRGDTTIGIYGTFIGGGWGGAPEINTILEYWAELAGLENEEEYEGDKVILRTYSSAESDTQIKYYLIKGLEHAWPIVANSTLDTPAVLWEFFSQYVPKE
jgi:polyhydroxybutyrate depolymerase